MGELIIGSLSLFALALITASKNEGLHRGNRSRVESIAHQILEYADETVGHAEGVSREELILETYHKLGTLLAQWSKKIDKIERVYDEPRWLKEYVKQEEATQDRSWVEYGPAAFGFEVDNLFFAKEKPPIKLSDDLLTISEPYTMWMEDFKELIDLCRRNHLDFYVDGFNSHQPGRTFRVVIYKPTSAPKSHREFREEALLALQVFADMHESSGKEVTREGFESALLQTGKFDQLSAERIIEILLAGKRIPNF